MPNTRTYSRSFSGGEISPEMFGRIDDPKYQSGAATMRNFIATPQGPAENRPGFAYVNGTKGNGVARLIPFTYSADQTMVLEIGAGYFRFHTQGQTLQYSASQPAFKPSGFVTYTVATPTVITWNGHPFSSGDPVVLAVTGVAPPGVHFTLPVGLNFSPYTVSVIDANSFHLLDGSGNMAAVTAPPADGRAGLAVLPNYALGDLASYGGATYYRSVLPLQNVPVVGSLDTNPASDGFWYQLPTNLTYELQNSYTAADLFDLHYVQSQDVITLVHPKYAPALLERLGPSTWTFTNVAFGPSLMPPANVTGTPSPGYQAAVSSITLATPAVITTTSNHTLSLGDGIYIKGLTATLSGGGTRVIDGFYLVDKVPADGTGALILNELQVMDYSGNVLDSSGWSSYSAGATIQLANKVYDPNSYYAVSAVAASGVSESELSTMVTVLNNLDVDGSYNAIAWSAVAGASLYNVYKKFHGLYGFIGQTTDTTFADNNIAPDMSLTPPTFDAVFGSATNYPAAVSYFEQRKCYAGTLDQPQNFWASKSGTEDNFSYSLPTKDTDRLAFQVATREANTIRHIVPLTQLILLTSSAELAVQPGGSDVLTPSNVGVRPQSYVGANNVQPSIVNNNLVYCAARGGHVREMAYQWQANGFLTHDISLRAAHLFDGLTIVDMCYMKARRPIVWFVSSNGDLLGLTYIPEEQLGAWHHHDTVNGAFESIACVSEGAEDFLYAVVRRQINGQTVRYVERMASRLVESSQMEDCFFVDAGSTYSGASTKSITGLTWLEGQTVSILADGCVMPPQVVTGGAITLFRAASTVQVGLPITADLETLPVEMMIDGYGQGRQKNVNKAWLKLYLSSGVYVGPDANSLILAKQRTTEPYGAPPNPFGVPQLTNGDVEVMTSPSWQSSGQVFIRQQDPLPVSVVGLTLEIAIGG